VFNIQLCVFACVACTELVSYWLSSLGGAVVERQNRDRKVAGLTPGRGAIKSTRSTQPSIPPG